MSTNSLDPNGDLSNKVNKGSPTSSPNREKLYKNLNIDLLDSEDSEEKKL